MSSRFPTYTLVAPEASFRAFAPLIVAEINQIPVHIRTDIQEFQSKSPTGKFPILIIEYPGDKEEDLVLFSSHAIARYLAHLRTDSSLQASSSSSLKERSAIDHWLDWSSQHLELPACVWFYPVAGYMPFQLSAYQKAKEDFKECLRVLNEHLLKNKTDYLVKNDQLSLADIVIASTLLYPFKLVVGPSDREDFPQVMEWFQRVVTEPEVQQVVGQVTLCQEELKAPGHE